MSEVEKKEAETDNSESSAQQQLPDLLAVIPGAPAQDQIEQWKSQYGEVFVSGFSEKELYVWRSLSRPEYVRLQMMLANPDNKIDQFKMEEMVCDCCILWPPGPYDWSSNKAKAGTPGTLSEQIMQNSNFFSAAAASMLVAKL